MRILYFDEYENIRVSEIDHIFIQYDETGQFVGVNIGSHDYVIAMCCDERIVSDYCDFVFDGLDKGIVDMRYDENGDPYYFEIMTEYEEDEE